MSSYIKTSLKDYQIAAKEKAKKFSRFVICFDPGQGKTLTSLAIFSDLKDQDPYQLCLVLSPKTALATWNSEIPKHSKFTWVENAVSSSYDISVISYSRVKEYYYSIVELLKNNPRVLLILDEAHLLRSSESDIADFLRKFLKLFPRVYALTATPMQNHIEDTYYFYSAMFPGIFGGFAQFMQAYTERVKKKAKNGGVYYEIVAYKNLNQLKQIISQTMFQHSIDYKLDFKFCYTKFTPEEELEYLTVARGMAEQSETLKEFVARLPELQLVVNNSSMQESDPLFQKPGLSSKEKKLVEVLTEINERNEAAVVFTFFKSSYYRLFKVISQHTKFMNYYRMSGDTPLFERKNIVDIFRQGDCLVSTMVASQSINLQEANNVIFYDTPWSVGSFIQACGRIARMNSRFPLKTVYIVGVEGTIDAYKQLLIQSHLRLIDQVIGGIYTYNKLLKDVSKRYIIEMRRELLWKSMKRHAVHLKGIKL